MESKAQSIVNTVTSRYPQLLSPIISGNKGRQHVYIREFKGLGRFFQGFAPILTKKGQTSETAKKRSERFNTCVKAVSKCFSYTLPSRFVADDSNCLLALQLALQSVNQDRITSLDFYNFIQNSTDPRVTPLQGYTESEVCVLPKSWSFIKITDRFLGKMLTDFTDIHSSGHSKSLAQIGYTIQNCTTWLPPILKDKIGSNIQNFQLKGQKRTDLALTYDIPVEIDPWQKALSLAQFPLDYVNFRGVFLFKGSTSSGSTFNKVGETITGFLLDRPLTQSEFKNLENPAPGTQFWCGFRANIQKFHQYAQTHGLSALKMPDNFSFIKLNNISSNSIKRRIITILRRHKNQFLTLASTTPLVVSRHEIIPITKSKAYKAFLKKMFQPHLTAIQQRVDRFTQNV